jgi:hypothetical protein
MSSSYMAHVMAICTVRRATRGLAPTHSARTPSCRTIPSRLAPPAPGGPKKPSKSVCHGSVLIAAHEAEVGWMKISSGEEQDRGGGIGHAPRPEGLASPPTAAPVLE